MTPFFRAFGIPDPEPEFRFAPPRRWRFDYAWPGHKVALEIEGGVWTGGRHTSGAGFCKDMEKYNAAAVAGWRVLRCQPKELRGAAIYELLNAALGETEKAAGC
jgi:very-short-patch-repair endonuclease